MLSDIDLDKKFDPMSEVDARWFDNIKKGIAQSDNAIDRKEMIDESLPPLLKALDIAAKLRLSLQDGDISNYGNRKKYLAFLRTGIPDDISWELFNKRESKVETRTICDVIYQIRCIALHENENLNHAENVDYHILLGWDLPTNTTGTYNATDKQLVCNGQFLVTRIRQHLSKFVTAIDTQLAMANNALSFEMTINPPHNSIQPERKPRQ